MRYFWRFTLLGCLLISACADDTDPVERDAERVGDHVWQAQENAYRKAQDVAPMLEETDQQRRALLEQQGG